MYSYPCVVAGLLAALCAAGVSAQTQPVAEAASPVNVTVYYESLCPDSIRFYVNQLYPTMTTAGLATRVALELVPYGKSSYNKLENGSIAFNCHHGERECYGNKVHVCALTYLTSQKERLSYLQCLLNTMLNDRQAVFPADKCAVDNHIPDQEKSKIIGCANSTESESLLAAMGDKTKLLQDPLVSVPTVVFNNKLNDNDFKQAQVNFKGVLCKYLSFKPAECAGTSGSMALGVSLSLVIASLVFSQY